MHTVAPRATVPISVITRRRFLTTAVTVTATVALSACGSSRSKPATDIPRVVALGYVKDADAALAAGVAPVAMPKPSGLPDTETWTLAALDALGTGKPELIDVGAEISIEQIAALSPT